MREWDEALRLEAGLSHDRTLQQHLCAVLDQHDASDAERVIETRFGPSAPAALGDCIRTTHDREALHNAVVRDALRTLGASPR